MFTERGAVKAHSAKMIRSQGSSSKARQTHDNQVAAVDPFTQTSFILLFSLAPTITSDWTLVL